MITGSHSVAPAEVAEKRLFFLFGNDPAKANVALLDLIYKMDAYRTSSAPHMLHYNFQIHFDRSALITSLLIQRLNHKVKCHFACNLLTFDLIFMEG